MINKNIFLNNIHPRVFWDCDMNKIDFGKSLNFVIARILMRGTDKEIYFIEDSFSLKRIVEAVEKSPEADKKCKNYYKTLLRLHNEFGE